MRAPDLLHPLHAIQPAHTALNKLLRRGLQLGLVQMKIIHGANAQNTLLWESRADAVHECAARGTEVVGHIIARGDRTRLAEGGQIGAAAQVLQVRVGNGKVGGEHGRGDFAAVRAIADEGVNQTRALGWLGVWVRC